MGAGHVRMRWCAGGIWASPTEWHDPAGSEIGDGRLAARRVTGLGTPFEPIYTKAAREDFGRSAKFFGQLVWYTVMKRPERWGSGRYQVDGRDIGSRTYFRLKDGA